MRTLRIYIIDDPKTRIYTQTTEPSEERVRSLSAQGCSVYYVDAKLPEVLPPEAALAPAVALEVGTEAPIGTLRSELAAVPEGCRVTTSILGTTAITGKVEYQPEHVRVHWGNGDVGTYSYEAFKNALRAGRLLVRWEEP